MLRRSGGMSVMERSSIRMSPVVGGVKPATIMRVVVFPDPLGPSSVTNSPGATSRSTWSTAMTLPYRLVTPERTRRPLSLRPLCLKSPFHERRSAAHHDPAARDDGVDGEISIEEDEVGVEARRDRALAALDPEHARDVRGDERQRLVQRELVGPDDVPELAMQDRRRRVVQADRV